MFIRDRRITAVLIAALMCPLSFAAAVSAESETAPIVSAESSYNNVAGGFTFVEEAGDEAALSAKLSGEVVPGAFIFYPDKSLALYDSAHGALGYFLERALTLLGSSSRPVVYVTDEAVSYTHLDVYKRQEVPCIAEHRRAHVSRTIGRRLDPLSAFALSRLPPCLLYTSRCV